MHYLPTVLITTVLASIAAAEPPSSASTAATEQKVPAKTVRRIAVPQGFHAVKLTPSDAGNLFLVDVTVDSTKTKFLLDSGAGRTMLYGRTLAEGLGRPLKRISGVSGVGGSLERFTTSFEKVTVAGVMELSPSEAHVIAITGLDSLRIGGKPVDVGGLAGSPLLASVKAVFDWRNACLFIPTTQAKSSWSGYARSIGSRLVPLQRGKFDYPMLVVTLKEKKWAFLIDTGANANTMTKELAIRLGLKAQETDTDIKGAGVHENASAVRMERFPLSESVELSGMSFYLVETGKSELDTGEAVYGGVLGTPAFIAAGARLDFGAYELELPAPAAATGGAVESK